MMIVQCYQCLSLAIKKINIKLNLCKKQVGISNLKSKFFNIHNLSPFTMHKLSLFLNLLIAYADFDI